MAQALPLAKIGTLLVKTLAKPVSKRIKRDFSRFGPTRSMLIGIGQATHSVTSRMTIWSEGYTVRHIAKLEEEKALSRGADFIGEGFILLVSVSTVVWEYNRSKEKERKQEAKQRAEAKAERDALQTNFMALDARLKALEEVVEYNTSSITNITGKRYVKPTKKELVPIAESPEQQQHPVEIQQKKQQQKQSEAHHVVQIQQPDANTDPQTMIAPTEKGTPWWKFW